MCTVSMIGDHYNDKWKQGEYENLFQRVRNNPQEISRAEFEALKKEVEDMKELLKKAKLYDEKNNEPNCEMESKITKLKEIAELMGISLEEVFK